jgi:hypothetical protein
LRHTGAGRFVRSGTENHDPIGTRHIEFAQPPHSIIR